MNFLFLKLVQVVSALIYSLCRTLLLLLQSAFVIGSYDITVNVLFRAISQQLIILFELNAGFLLPSSWIRWNMNLMRSGLIDARYGCE